MALLFFDTETSGLPDDRLPLDDALQPHIVQLAAQLCEDDGAPIGSVSLIVNPGVEIPAAAARIHGIMTAKAERFGVPPALALSAFQHLYKCADLIVAHNIAFDKKLMEILIARVYGQLLPLRKPLYCTMSASTPIVNLPPTDRMLAVGRTGPKPPKLVECMRHFFDEDLPGAHDAMNDVVACRRVYLHLQSLEGVKARVAEAA